jgi:tetratricopeptide (TPR) repeat protein
MSNTALFSFTPSLMDVEALEAIFVQRKDLAVDLVERVRESALTSAKLHTLIVGARGMGKTHLVSLVYYRIQAMPDLKERLLIAWLREEEWGVTSFLDLLLRILRALAEADPTVEERMEVLYNLSSEEAEAAGAKLLNELIGERTLWLIAENLDDLFSGLGEQGQQHLRAFLQTHGNCTVLATSPRLFNGVQRRTAPFYGFFRPVHLNELTTEEAQQLLINIATWRQQNELAAFLQTSTGQTRVKAVQHLAGGNPRVYIIFADFLTYQSLDELVSPFMSLVDALTPYYQSRMQYLSPQQRKIVELLCEKKYAVPVKIIAQRCFMTAQTASSQLKDLREKGYVKPEAIGRESFYEITEPLMRICLGVKKERGEPLRLLVDFLRVWYPRNELQFIQKKLLLATEPTASMCSYLQWALKDGESTEEDPRVQACVSECLSLWSSKNYEEALEISERAVTLNPLSGEVWVLKGITLSYLERFREANNALITAIEIKPDFIKILWIFQCLSLLILKEYEKALFYLSKGIETESSHEATQNIEFVYLIKGWAYFSLGEYQEALTSTEKLLEINRDNRSMWFVHGSISLKLGQYNEAINSYIKSLGSVLENESDKSRKVKKIKAVNNPIKDYEALEIFLEREDISRFAFLTAFIRNLALSSLNFQQLRTNIEHLVDRIEKHSKLIELAAILIRAVAVFSPEIVSLTKATVWRDAWAEVVGDKPEFEIPLRLLNTALHYKQTPNNPRIFLELPIEERKILQQALGIEHKLN